MTQPQKAIEYINHDGGPLVVKVWKDAERLTIYRISPQYVLFQKDSFRKNYIAFLDLFQLSG
ncbi:hypothetical protein E6C60_3269 [Paenibacillus algicola]|uniref:Uncharacterized protein n=1 Tax=Paenibacillus algicola TaxID=2565926 RepID=A0A4P8XQ80_9BACL|nr:hypothetical protein E6C60_3269 [Paenibacillus algicola]